MIWLTPFVGAILLLTFVVNGHRLPASPGSCILLPRGSDHGYAIESEAAHLLVILTPAGAEGYLAALHESALVLVSPSRALERLVTTAARYDIDITGPPPIHGVPVSG